MLVVDIGGGTTDLCYVCPGDIGEKTLMLKGDRGVSTLDGSVKINKMFIEHLRTQVPRQVLEALLGLASTALEFDDVLEFFSSEFEFHKRIAGKNPQAFVITTSYKTHLSTRDCHGIQETEYPDFLVTEDGLLVKGGVMQRIFCDWLKNIFHVVDKTLRRLQRQSATIVLTGWGSRPPYVFAAFVDRYSRQGVNVEMVSDLAKTPVVAQGGFLALATQKNIMRKVARADLMYRLNSTSSFRHLDHEGTAQILVEEGADLGNLNQQFSNRRTVITENPVFPLTLKLDILTNREFGTMENEGTIQLELESLERCGFQLEQRAGGIPVLELEYSVKIDLSGLGTLLVMTVPYTGHFDDIISDSSLDMVVSELVNIEKHAALMEGIDEP
ncbi:uncharacterized protein Z520_07389 [Fonsecaea multimorphosa CBS 102226]|uniref:Uncharacterized protein n=1 Tax=Fonsecaea multimorphosa CBS 102226 TaxID=1442371 RepID=A0A0D2H493_9EURO|nr:uncharacterized protein Z520_07389 [Fonsecaea multimorphosa CBS 102226]KIX96670.1 hypothetical protein Z520_07389 [Fonsecaea multimorphosa CBS 102226]OAL20751.1 hypothetical protein AYO22_08760 [Fonsecaea multimorphosa]